MKNNTLELKLYSPITGHLMEDNWDEDDFDVSFYDYEGTPLSPYEMTAFEDVVHKAIEDEKMPEEVERGLMEYYSGHEPASVDQKVLSAFVDAEVYLRGRALAWNIRGICAEKRKVHRGRPITKALHYRLPSLQRETKPR